MTAPLGLGSKAAGSRFRAAILALAFAAPLLAASLPARAQETGYMRITAAEAAAGQAIDLGINKSMVVDLPRPAGDVLVSNPEIADAVLRSATRLYLIGVKLGRANVFLFDSTGAQIGSLDISVAADLSGLNQLLAEAIPDGYVRADALNGSIVLRGQVRSSSDSSRASELTRAMIATTPTSVTTIAPENNAAPGVGSAETSTFDPANGPGVINLLTITGEEQVALKVTIAEVQRNVSKQLGININGSIGGGDLEVGTGTAGALGGLSPLIPSAGLIGTAGEIGASFSAGDFNIQATLRALDETNMIHTLAEPTLTAVSGETANFLAGGEFGYRTLQVSDSGGAVYTTSFKPFGVQLAFTPIVLSPGRISIKVRTSVSEITGLTDGIPSLSTRSTETTVEQPSGGSFVIGGLVQQNMRRAVTGFPGLQRLPVLGALFSSKRFLADETELVMIVTPYLVKPTSPAALARPGDNLVMSGDADAYFHNRLTKVYGAASEPASTSGARVGFTFD